MNAGTGKTPIWRTTYRAWKEPHQNIVRATQQNWEIDAEAGITI
jgi:hypothetical protein